jgi:hypothetical protein
MNIVLWQVAAVESFLQNLLVPENGEPAIEKTAEAHLYCSWKNSGERSGYGFVCPPLLGNGPRHFQQHKGRNHSVVHVVVPSKCMRQKQISENSTIAIIKPAYRFFDLRSHQSHWLRFNADHASVSKNFATACWRFVGMATWR